MDINGNMELENFELVVGKISEGDNMSLDSNLITEEMVLSSIKENRDNNRRLNRSVNQAIYELVRSDLLEHSMGNARDL